MVTPDWKTPPPDREPSLLREIHEAWQPFGCSICGHRPAPGAPSGAQIEVHHLLSRAQGGDDSWENTLGLCGELCPQKCHWRVTTNRLSIDFVVDVGWCWTDRETGEEGVCRNIGREVRGEVIGPDTQAALDKLTMEHQRGPAIAVDRLPDIAKLPGRAGCEERFLIMQTLWRRLQADFLVVTLLVHKARVDKEWAVLGFETWKEYGEAIGIASPTLSKMLYVAKRFRGNWVTLSEADRADLTMDRLYYAGKLLDLGEYDDEEDALHSAVATPQRYIWEAYLAANAAKYGDTQHRCPDCGFLHNVVEPDA